MVENCVWTNEYSCSLAYQMLELLYVFCEHFDRKCLSTLLYLAIDRDRWDGTIEVQYFQDTFCHSSSNYHGIKSPASLLPISGINAVVVVIKKCGNACWSYHPPSGLCLESLKFVDTESIMLIFLFYFIFYFYFNGYATEIDILGTALPHNLCPALQYDFVYIQHMIIKHTLDCTP
jgi:hypothetical protein